MSDLPRWARVGAKVVCVRPAADGSGNSVVERQEYIVVRVLCHSDVVYVGVAGHPLDCDWYASRFRPLITQEDDLEAHFNVYLKTDHRATRRVGEDA